MAPFGKKKRNKDEEKIKLTKDNWKNGVRIFNFLKPYKGTFLIGILFLFLSSLASLAFPKFMGQLLQQATDNNGDFSQVNNIALGLLILFACQSVFSYFRVVLFINVTEKTIADIRTTFFSHLVKMPMYFFDKNRVGELNSRISSDIALLKETMTTTSAEIIRQAITLIGGIILLFLDSAELALFMLAVLPVIIILAVFFGKKLRTYSKMVQQTTADSQNIVEEVLQAIQNVKAFSNEVFEINRYGSEVDVIKKYGIKGGKLRAAFISFIVFGVFGAIVAVVWYGVRLIQQGELTIGGLTEFLLLTIFIAASLGSLGDLYAQFQKAVGAADKIMSILDEDEEMLNDDSKKDIVLNGSIEFNNVSFSYPSRLEFEVLKNVSLKINAGEQIAIVGGSGAGKSTIASLLYQFYNTTKGDILFDGQSSSQLNLTNVRNQMAIVPQELILFGGTIQENIAYGKTSATFEEIKEAAKQAFALDFIEKFPEGFETIVGERGIQLSGGQRQRIAIARAILKDPKVLILDEATSALDSESETFVQNALDNLMKNRTSIVIAHRLSTVRMADKIVVLNEGTIVEVGNHDELMNLENGFYKNMKQLQI